MSPAFGRMDAAAWEEQVHATRQDWHALAVRAAELRTRSEDCLYHVLSGHGITTLEADKLISRFKSDQQAAGLESFLQQIHSDQPPPPPSWEELPELLLALHQEWERALFYLEKENEDLSLGSSRNRRELKAVREQNRFQPGRTLPEALLAPLPVIAPFGDEATKSGLVSVVDVLLATPAEVEGEEQKSTLDERLAGRLQHHLQVARVLAAFSNAWSDQVEILRETAPADPITASEPEPEPAGWRFWRRWFGGARKKVSRPAPGLTASWADPFPANVPVDAVLLRQLSARRKQTAIEAGQLKETDEYLTARVAGVKADLDSRNEDWKRHQNAPADLDRIGHEELADTEKLLAE